MIPTVTMTMKFKNFFWWRCWQRSQSKVPMMKCFVQQWCQQNQQASYTRKKCHQNWNFFIDLTKVSNDIKPKLDEPQMFSIAWNDPNKESHKKWQKTICKKFMKMNKQQVWQKMLKSLMSPNCRCIKNKVVFEIKHKNVYWVYLVACGFGQVPGVNFSKSTIR